MAQDSTGTSDSTGVHPALRAVATQVGLPSPTPLRRWQPGEPILPGPALVTGPDGSRVATTISESLAERGVDLATAEAAQLAAVVVDASAARTPAELADVHAALVPHLKTLHACGRIVLIGTQPGSLPDPQARATQHALTGFTRSLAKELRDGSTANLVFAAADDDQVRAGIAHTVVFLLSGRSAYVNAQTIVVGTPPAGQPIAAVPEVDRPLAGQVAVVTGAARGIGATIAATLSRDGATCVLVDVPAAGQALAQVANEIGATAVQLDVTSEDAGRRLAEVGTRLGGLNLMVHNAGITRDKLLANMDDARWRQVLEVNLAAQLRIDDALLGAHALADGARFVALSSTSGIAGNRGQTNYAASKAGVIGMVTARAAQLAGDGYTYNAVAPGFIETDMTARIPRGIREIGRRLNSLRQGGQPVDVAEMIGFFAHPGAAGVTGQVVRVCGQSLVGA